MSRDDQAYTAALIVLAVLVYLTVVLVWGGLLARRLQHRRDQDRARARALRRAVDQRPVTQLAHRAQPVVVRRVPVPRRPAGSSRAGADEH